jgi:predicted glycosyltransferase
VGNPGDLVDDPLGPGLPSIREWTAANFEFTGYVNDAGPLAAADRARLRAEFGWAPGELVCVASVGGSGAGEALLRRVIAAGRLMPQMRLVVVAGPRIDPASLPSAPGLEIHGYVDRMHRMLAACDVAVTHGGLTTTMTLTAYGRPFVYVPLQNHFEQNRHVRRRLEEYGSGVCLEWTEATPEGLAAALGTALRRPVAYRPVETDGAERAAELLAELL